MKKGIVIFALLVIAGIVAAFVWRSVLSSPAQYVTISGQTYRFAGITYGTNHVMSSWLGRLVNRLPQSVANILTPIAGSGRVQTTTTEKPSVCVWFEPRGSTSAAAGGTTVEALLADEHGTVGGPQKISFAIGGMASTWFYFTFADMPRRSRTIECALYEYVTPPSQSGKYNEVGRVHFPNPLYAQYPQWHPEALPAARTNGDLVVTLDNFVSGVSGSAVTEYDSHGGQKVVRSRAGIGEEPQAAFDLTFSPGKTNCVWTFAGGEFSDATGNHIHSTSWGNSANHVSMGPVLWPGESAWRLKLELKRSAGLEPDELIVFRNVPVPELGATNKPSVTNMVGGMEMDLTEFERLPNITGNSWNSDQASDIHAHHSTLPKDMSLDFVSVETEDQQKIEVVSQSWSENNYDIWLKAIPTNATRLNITYALQKTRTVEFMVKP